MEHSPVARARRRRSSGAVVPRADARALVRPRHGLARLALRHDGPAALHARAAARRRRAALGRRHGRHQRRDRGYAGYATMIFMIGWAAGGLVFGVLGDRIGRVRTMIFTILAVLGLHRSQRLCRRLLGFRVLPPPDRPRCRRPVRRRGRARCRNGARPRAAVRPRVAPGGVDLREHARGARRHRARRARAVRCHRQRVAQHVRHRRPAGAAVRADFPEA